MTPPRQKKKKTNEKREKYLNFVRDIKNLCNMKVPLVRIVVGVLRILFKLFDCGELETRGIITVIQTAALLKSTRILKRSQEI